MESDGLKETKRIRQNLTKFSEGPTEFERITKTNLKNSKEFERIRENPREFGRIL